jgi:chemotaxis response regulator CheB
MSIRVAIVDDQALMRDGFSMILDAQPDIDVVGDAENGRLGVELCLRTRPDVVLMDIRRFTLPAPTAKARSRR